MRMLILGGTVFLGRHLAEIATARGHEVTLFNRGRTDIELFPDLEMLFGDRDKGERGLQSLRGRTWDAVVDTSGYLPHQVRESAAALSGAAGQYTFVSSISVLADPGPPGQTEQAPLAQLPPDADPTERRPETYGACKALCEAALRETFDGRTLVVRPGLIVGPHDPSDRFTYWPRRIRGAGEILAPPAAQPVQFIDVRDLADWIVRLNEARIEATLLGTGPKVLLTMGELLYTAQQVLETTPTFVFPDEDFLLEQGVAPFTDLPLWVPAEARGFLQVDLTEAWSHGLSCRPVEQTLVDTFNWDAARPRDTEIAAGLSLEREAQLLATWARRQAEGDGPA